jgi:drug/metabolite transporter (DMT)-like permease
VKVVFQALVGIILYAVQNTIIDVKLKQYSTLALLLQWYLVMLPLGAAVLIYQWYWGKEIIMPSGTDFKLVAAIAVMFFIADALYIGAFQSGGDVVTITILATLIPVMGAGIKWGWLGEAPTRYHFAAFIFAVLAVSFIAIGNSKKATTSTTTTIPGEVVVVK